MRISDWSSDVCSSDRALAGSVVLSPQAARASAPIEVRRTVRSRVMFFFLHKGANAGLLSGLERKVEFRFERGPGGDFGVAPVDEKTGRAFDMVGAAADVGHAGEFGLRDLAAQRSEEHTSELQSLMRISYAVFCLKKKNKTTLDHDFTH